MKIPTMEIKWNHDNSKGKEDHKSSLHETFIEKVGRELIFLNLFPQRLTWKLLKYLELKFREHCSSNVSNATIFEMV